MNEAAAKREVPLVPPFSKGELGGIWECHAQAKSLPLPLLKGNRTVCLYFHAPDAFD